jgi:hypothetical protein
MNIKKCFKKQFLLKRRKEKFKLQRIAQKKFEEGLQELEKKFQKNAWEFFEYVRGETKHEHSLLTGRVTWYITCQSFLLTVYAVSYCNSKAPNWFSNLLLPFLAIAITVLASYMIQGATTTIEMWSKLRFALLQKHPELSPILISRWHLPTLKGPVCLRTSKDFIHLKALWFPRFIPFLFTIAWIAIAFFSWKYPWI